MWVHQYWTWAGSNIGAMPAETVIGVAAGFIFRTPISWALQWFRKERDQAMYDAREDAAKARKIAADLYRHVTGEDHPHAPAAE